MSRAIVKHMKSIQKQREILEDWTAYEYELDRFWDRPANAVVYDFESLIAGYHHNLELAEIRLKSAATHGAIVDITDTELGHDIRCVSDPKKTGNPKGDKIRIRSNLVKLDFYERFGRLPEATAFKLTIPKFTCPKPDAPVADLALAIQITTYVPVVLAVFADTADAMLYRLALQ